VIPHHLSFDHLKRAVSVECVLAANGLSAALKRSGNRLVGPCPLHGGDNPNAFVVQLDRNLWYCFTRCGTGGDVIELARRLGHGSYSQAAQYLASLAQCPQQAQELSTASPPPCAASPSFTPYTRHLPLDPTAPFLLRKGIHPATASRFDAGAYRGAGFCADSIAVRLHDLRGQPLGYAARRLDPDQIRQHGKWKLPPRLPKSQLLYGYHHCVDDIRNRGVVVVECPWGVMRLAQLSVPAVAVLGTTLSAVQCRLLAQAPTVVIMFDGDSAGREGTRRAVHMLAGATTVRTARLPDGLDPDDLTDGQLREALRTAFR
jgi:DNA primase